MDAVDEDESNRTIGKVVRPRGGKLWVSLCWKCCHVPLPWRIKLQSTCLVCPRVGALDRGRRDDCCALIGKSKDWKLAEIDVNCIDTGERRLRILIMVMQEDIFPNDSTTV